MTHASCEPALAAWNRTAAALDRLAQRSADCLETGLDHVMRVLAAHAEVQVRAERIAETAEEMRHEFARQSTHTLARECAFEHEVRPSGQIECDLGETLVHRQQET